MSEAREPVLLPVPLAELRPTQVTVGMREVEIKRKSWRERSKKRGETFLGQHMIPTVLGPKRHHYVIDHHHLGLALIKEGVESVLAHAVADLSRLEGEAFWATMDARGWVHAFDDKGKRCDYDDIPRSLRGLADDPFRSLAGELRRMGGFAKETLPFSEFLWADFLRRRIKRRLVDADFDRALEKAMAYAKSEEADYLPGWSGAHPDD